MVIYGYHFNGYLYASEDHAIPGMLFYETAGRAEKHYVLN